MTEQKKIRIYCGFAGSGKTYFCKHHAGWVDLDEQTAVEFKLNPQFLTRLFHNYAHYGYRIITNATPYVFYSLKDNLDKYEVIIVLPPKEMKEEILQRVYNRGDTEWYPYLKQIYDTFYQNTISFPINATKIWLKPGQYIEDIIKEIEEENLD